MPARLFVALDLPAPAARAVAALCTGLPGARWSDPAQLHLTLRFMAAVPDATVATVTERLDAIHAAPFSLSLRGVGVFPSGRKPARVLWAGVTPAEPVLKLKSAIDGVLGPDDEAARGFHPHLTLARFREAPGPGFAAYLAAHESFTSPPWTADAFVLYRSMLGAAGRATRCCAATLSTPPEPAPCPRQPAWLSWPVLSDQGGRPMRAALFATAFAFILAIGAGPAAAADQAPDKAAKAEKKPAANEVTLNGEMVCAKCVLHESKQCQNVLKVTEAGAETKYYLADNKTAKDNHGAVCGATAKATVTGKVSDKAGKKVLTASSIKYE